MAPPPDGDAAGGSGGDAEQDPAAEVDFYKLLGVERDAANDEIRRGYLKAALHWHPDKNPGDKERAEAMFKKVANAYQVLSEREGRRIYDEIYDREGVDGLRSSGFFPGEDSVISMDVSFRLFRSMHPDLVPYAAFSDGKLSELFPDMFSRGRLTSAGEKKSRL
ncbi:unnamed protein product [Polarella glacialis]|uniref:J domain-containing protein n=1 Tax=Polarella glacialis TaxID=89957 RepID=A0A813DIM6_POLGL|nr:unnamed protein product [Polarella glacialis]CAE8644840.1 unnamed protein product [Polarella glacialis]